MSTLSRSIPALGIALCMGASAHAAPLSAKVFRTPAEAARAEGVDTMGRWLRTKIPPQSIRVTQIAVSPTGRSTRHLVAGAQSKMEVSVLATKAGFRAFDTRGRKYERRR